PFLEAEESRAFAQQEAVARRIEGPARTLWRVVVGRYRRQKAEARESDRADHRIETSGERAIHGAAAEQLHRRSERLATGSARRMHGGGVAADVVAARQQRDSRRGL